VVVVIAVVVVIMVIPIAICPPAMSVLIPPSVTMRPTEFPRIMQFATPAFRLSALGAVMLDRFVQFVIGSRNASLAFIRAQLRRAREHQKAGQCRQTKCLSEEPLEIVHHSFSPPAASILPLNYGSNNCKKRSTLDSRDAMELIPLDTSECGLAIRFPPNSMSLLQRVIVALFVSGLLRSRPADRPPLVT
jgi:hypothetical protein